MAIAFDAASTKADHASSLSWSHTVTGSNPILLVATAIDSSTAVTTLTYAGYSLRQIATTDNGIVLELWYLANPPTGTSTVSVTFAGSNNAVGIATSYTGVDPNVPLGTSTTSSGSGTTATVNVTAVTGDLVVDAVGVNNIDQDGLTVGAGQTQRAQKNSGAASGLSAATSSETGAASVTMSWTWSGSNLWRIIGVPLRPLQVVKEYNIAYRILNVYRQAIRR